MMKRKCKLLSMVLAAVMVLSTVLTGCAAGNTTPTVDAKSVKTLIVYYSYSGTTQRAAEHLQELTDGTLYELELTEPYTGSSNDVSYRVFAERDDNKMPELSGTLPDISEYDRILIGTPVWNDSMANPISSYLEQTDFDGKTVSLFWTYITNEGSTERDFAKQAQNAQVADGLALRSANGMDDDKLDSKLQNWLDKLPAPESE